MVVSEHKVLMVIMATVDAIGAVAAANELGISRSYLWLMTSRKRPITDELAKWAGYRRLPAEQRFARLEEK